MSIIPKLKAKKNRGVQRAISVAGSQEKLAAKCEVTHGAVAKWLWRSCPAERAVQIEEVTGIPRSEIRPDLYQSSAND